MEKLTRAANDPRGGEMNVRVEMQCNDRGNHNIRFGKNLYIESML
jgi:hypothetical protein